MMHLAIRVAYLSIALAYPSVSEAEPVPDPPSESELELIVRHHWSHYAVSIRRQDGLNFTPSVFRSLPQAICRNVWAEHFECVSLIEYDLPSGIKRSSLVRQQVRRDDQGRLAETIVIREKAPSR
jgi:hypothetical protein